MTTENETPDERKSEWSSQQERSNSFSLRLILWITRNMGRWAGRALLYPITLYFLVGAPAARRSSRQYLDKVLGRPASLMDLARHIHTFSSTILDRIFLLTDQHERLDVRPHDEQIVQDIASRGKGCILLISHHGSFEVLRAMGITAGNLPVKIVMHRAHNQRITEIFDALNPDIAKSIIDTGEPDSLTILKIQEALAEGCLVGIMADRVHVVGERTVECEFLGEPAHLPSTPMLIASILDVPVVLCFGLYQGGNRYDLHFELFADEINVPRKQRAQGIQQWTQRYANRLEHYARLAPYNWFNFYDYWSQKK